MADEMGCEMGHHSPTFPSVLDEAKQLKPATWLPCLAFLPELYQIHTVSTTCGSDSEFPLKKSLS